MAELKERNYSIDALRVLSMLMIVSLHSISHGIVETTWWGGVSLYSLLFQFVTGLSVVSVNVYVLISGYFLVYEKFRISKVWKIAIETLFYSWAIFGILYKNGVIQASGKEILAAIFPVSYNEYWFVSAYVAMYLLSPIVNVFLKNISQRQHLGVIIILVSIFCIWSDIMPFSHPMGVLPGGYSLVWFVTLYIIAAYIRKYINESRWHVWSIRIYILCAFILVLIWAIIVSLASRLGIELPNDITGYYYSYNSVPVLLGSLALFQYFRGISINGSFAKKLIVFFAPLTFGVYLIHDNFFMRDIVWSYLQQIYEPSLFLIPLVFFYVIVVFLICSIIDYCRSLLFSIVSKRGAYRCWLKRIDENSGLILEHLYKKLR